MLKLTTPRTITQLLKTTPKPEKSNNTLIIEPARGWSALRLHELWEFRDLLYFMVWRDLKARYRQTALGPLWIILQPLVNMVIYSVVFGLIAKLPSEGKPYTVFSYVALLPWTFFQGAVGSASTSLLGNKDLISKVYFPRLFIPLAQIVSSAMDFGFSFLILIGLLVYYQIQPTWGIALIPVYLAIAGLTGLGVGLWFAGSIVRFRDIGQFVGYLVRAWMYASPVVYSITVIPEQWRPLYSLNPMVSVVEGFRWALLGTAQPEWRYLVFAILMMIPLLLGGLYVYKRAERTIVDVV